MPTIFHSQKQSAEKQHHEVIPDKKPHDTPQEESIPNPSLKQALEVADKLIHTHPKPMGLFAAFAKQPKGVIFVNQEPDEAILLFLRRHFITNIPWILATLILCFLPPVILFFLSLIAFSPPPGITIVLIGFYYLIVSTYAFSHFISWFYNIGIVTQKRIIDLDSLNILAHNTTTANFDEIVDVTFHQRGFFQSTFDYGNIHIQTEAMKTNFEFDATPKPTEVTDIISDLRVAQKEMHHGNNH